MVKAESLLAISDLITFGTKDLALLVIEKNGGYLLGSGIDKAVDLDARPRLSLDVLSDHYL